MYIYIYHRKTLAWSCSNAGVVDLLGIAPCDARDVIGATVTPFGAVTAGERIHIALAESIDKPFMGTSPKSSSVTGDRGY
jgi:hypothetical protein